MMGFIVSTSAVLLTAWLVHVVSYQAGHVAGYLAGRTKFQDHRCSKGLTYRIGCLECGEPAMRVAVSVPVGTHPDSYEAKAAHVRFDDRIYGRNG